MIGDKEQLRTYALFIAVMNIVALISSAYGAATGMYELAIGGTLFFSMAWPINLTYILAYYIGGSIPGAPGAAEEDMDVMGLMDDMMNDLAEEIEETEEEETA